MELTKSNGRGLMSALIGMIFGIAALRVKALYLAMSTLNERLSGRSARPKSVAGVERQNGAWVDFLWSDLGCAGARARTRAAR